jgi:serine/threonine-protein kinase
MLVGQQLGPFAIEKELGSGAMGTVYRGVYTQTGQRMAIKVMAPGLGTTNDHAAERFEREINVLKQLRHPNIVRLFGAGKQHGTRYFAMEYVEGESLDKLMARRGRMSWEEVVQLGQQLCSALQHAHEKGIVHRDLKPSNLMILSDGTLKLTDFGIAKDLDVTQLTGANCTVGTAAYMSPEQCRGERDLTFKSDLYSMGVVFYELSTGRKPFIAEHAMDMFLQHVNGTFERPSRLVLDMPVWLDTLICQLLEKKPEHRPLNAALVAESLGSIQEKVEAQQSAGVDAARARFIDRPRGQRGVDETDKEAARTLQGKKGKRKKKRTPFYQQIWFVAVGVLALLGGLFLTLWLVFRPAAPEKLYARAEQLLASKNPDDWKKAREEPIKEYLRHYAKRPDLSEMTAKVLLWANEVDARECDQRLQTWLRQKRKGFNIEVREEEGEGLVLAWKAVLAEDNGDLADARAKWAEAAEKAPDTGWGYLAKGRVTQLDTIKAREEKWFQELWDQLLKTGKEPKLEGPEQQAFLAVRLENLGDLGLAHLTFEKLKKATTDDTDNRLWYLLATRKVKELAAEKESWPKDRKELVRKALADVRDTTSLHTKYALCQNVIHLYDGNKDLKADEAEALKPFLEEARDLSKEIGKQLKID